MPIAARSLRRNEFYRDGDGRLCIVMQRDEVKPLGFDWIDDLDLDNDESISTSTWDQAGVTVSSPTIINDPVSGLPAETQVTVTGTGGWIKNTITTTTGRTLVDFIHIHSHNGGIPVWDYGMCWR
jgi:hypothetical protein